MNNNGDLKIYPTDYANRDNGAHKRLFTFGFIQINLTTPDPKVGMSPYVTFLLSLREKPFNNTLMTGFCGAVHFHWAGILVHSGSDSMERNGRTTNARIG